MDPREEHLLDMIRGGGSPVGHDDGSQYLNDTGEGVEVQHDEHIDPPSSIEVEVYVYRLITSRMVERNILIDTFQASGSRSSKGKRGSKKKMEGRMTITAMSDEGEPLAPEGVKTTLVNQCGYLVRENIPISYPLWKRNSKTDEEADIVPETEKEMLWNEVKLHFSFPEDKEAILKKWVMKRMATCFQTFKKHLTADFHKKVLT